MILNRKKINIIEIDKARKGCIITIKCDLVSVINKFFLFIYQLG